MAQAVEGVVPALTLKSKAGAYKDRKRDGSFYTSRKIPDYNSRIDPNSECSSETAALRQFG